MQGDLRDRRRRAVAANAGHRRGRGGPGAARRGDRHQRAADAAQMAQEFIAAMARHRHWSRPNVEAGARLTAQGPAERGKARSYAALTRRLTLQFGPSAPKYTPEPARAGCVSSAYSRRSRWHRTSNRAETEAAQGGKQGGQAHPVAASLPWTRSASAKSPAKAARRPTRRARPTSSRPKRPAQAGSKGGQAAHQKGTAHEFDSEEAREAGRKGGQASGANAVAAKAVGKRLVDAAFVAVSVRERPLARPFLSGVRACRPWPFYHEPTFMPPHAAHRRPRRHPGRHAG